MSYQSDAQAYQDAILQQYIAMQNAQGDPASSAANEYGVGFDPSLKSNPYKQLGYNSGAINNVFKQAGIAPQDLLGFDPAPQMPDPTNPPYVSDLVTSVQNNPVYADLAQAIANGMDPSGAATAMWNDIQKDPTKQSSVPGTLAEFQAKAAKFAEELAHQTRAAQDYQGQVDTYNNFAKPHTAFQDAGSPTVDTLLGQYGLRSRQAQSFGGSDLAPKPGLQSMLTGGATPRVDLSNKPTQTPGVTLDPHQEAVGRILETAAQQKLDRLKGTETPSTQELQNRARLQQAWALMFGEAAPHRVNSTGGYNPAPTNAKSADQIKNELALHDTQRKQQWYAQASKNDKNKKK